MSWPPQVIVVAIDGSDQSQRAADLAAALARAHTSRLVMITVVRPPEGWWGVTGQPPSPEALSEALVEGQQEILRQAENRTNLAGIEYGTAEELGDPTSVILAACERESADLLVVGRRGAGLVERVVMGSVADRLAHHSPVPILIVP